MFIKRFSWFFLFCFVVNSTGAQTLTLYAYPAAHPYRWHSPHSLLVSTIRNYYFSDKKKPVRLIGHMIIELKKDTSTILTAIEADEIDELSRAIKKEKTGLGVFFKPVPGHLEEREDLETELHYRTQVSRAAFISFKLSDSSYQYLKTYLDSFNIKGYDKLYNGLNSPRSGEGSGCTAFGISFLELVNALLPEYQDQWAINVNVPEKLIGNSETKKKISIWRIFFSFRWARAHVPSRPLHLYEPDLVYRWINNVYKNEEKLPTGKYRLKTNGNAKGLEIDCVKCLPQYPMFLDKLASSAAEIK